MRSLRVSSRGLEDIVVVVRAINRNSLLLAVNVLSEMRSLRVGSCCVKDLANF